VLAAPPPARGRPVADPLLCLLRLCMISGITSYVLRSLSDFCLAWSDFPTGGGAPGLSSDVLLHPCLHHIIVMNSEAAACMMHRIIAHTCFTLPTSVFHIPCIHHLLLYMKHEYCANAQLMPVRPLLPHGGRPHGVAPSRLPACFSSVFLDFFFSIRRST
jgi:hypothetical protein